MVPIKLIFVDDDPDDRDLIKEGLLSLGADSFLVLESGKALFEYLDALREEQLPEAIVLDLNMPEMGGMDILKLLKSSDKYQQISIYILTTTSTSAFKQQCIAAGATGYYTKPNSLIELNTILNEIYDAV
jgi:two-component system chemotaxis response regulator CheY